MTTPKRKCSFRYMVLRHDGTSHILTQDIRRSHKVITGYSHVGFRTKDHHRAIAKKVGCSVIFKPKGANL